MLSSILEEVVDEDNVEEVGVEIEEDEEIEELDELLFVQLANNANVPIPKILNTLFII